MVSGGLYLMQRRKAREEERRKNELEAAEATEKRGEDYRERLVY
jgi:hypothetical protein